VQVGVNPAWGVVNLITNKIYIVNMCGNDPTCTPTSPATVTVIDGATDATTTVTVGRRGYIAAVNELTNKVYVANARDNTVSVIDGATNLLTATIQVGPHPIGLDVDPFTNRIYVANEGQGANNTVSVIDGWTNSVVGTVTVGWGPLSVIANPVTGKILW
jgi:YVTN family beta-propeller protein